MLPIWAQWLSLIGVIGVLITVVSIAVGGWLKVVRRLDRMDLRLDRIDDSIQQIRLQGNSHLSITGSLVTALFNQGAISAGGVLGHNPKLRGSWRGFHRPQQPIDSRAVREA